MCLKEDIYSVLGKLRSGLSCSPVGHEFNATESKLCINQVSLKRSTHETRLYTETLMKM